MKKILTTLILIEALLCQVMSAGNVPAGNNLVPPTAFSHIVEDVNGNMQFMDISTGPITLANLASNQIVNTSTITANAVTVKNNIFMGTPGTSVSTATTAGSSLGTIYQGFMDVGGSTVAAAAVGSALCASTTTNANNNVTVMVCPKTLGDLNFVGIAATVSSTGTVVSIYDTGWVLALTTGSVNPGDPVVVSTQSVGYLEHYTTTNSSGAAIVGLALGFGNTAGGSTRIKLR